MSSEHFHFVLFQEVVEHLLERGANVNATNKTGFTPFFTAVGWKRREIAEVREYLSSMYHCNDNYLLYFFASGRARGGSIGAISEFGIATAHSNDAFFVGIKNSITIQSIKMEIFIPMQNASFECAEATPNSLIATDQSHEIKLFHFGTLDFIELHLLVLLCAYLHIWNEL